MITIIATNVPNASVSPTGLPTVSWQIQIGDSGYNTIATSSVTPIGSSIQMVLPSGAYQVVADALDQNGIYTGTAGGYNLQDGSTYVADFPAGTIILEGTGLLPDSGFDISQYFPMPPNEGPPFPKAWKIYWPWYKGVK